MSSEGPSSSSFHNPNPPPPQSYADALRQYRKGLHQFAQVQSENASSLYGRRLRRVGRWLVPVFLVQYFLMEDWLDHLAAAQVRRALYDVQLTTKRPSVEITATGMS